MNLLRNALHGRRGRIAALLAVLASAASTVAYGYFAAESTPGTSNPVVVGRSLPTVAAPTTAVDGAKVTVSIPQVSIDGRRLGEYPNGGYTLLRYTAASSEGVEPGGTCAGLQRAAEATITCQETLSDPAGGTFTYRAVPALNSFRGVPSAASNAAVVAPTVPVDARAPEAQTVQMFDTDTDGKVDRLQATFDEDLAPVTNAPTTGWTMTNAPSTGLAARTVTTSGKVATVTLDEGTETNTAASSPTDVTKAFVAALAKPATGTNNIEDAAGNQAAFSKAVADKAAPKLLGVTSTDGDFKAENNDVVTFQFTENMASIAASTGSLATGAGASASSLTLGNVIGATSLGRNYFDRDGRSVSFNQTVATPTNGRVAVTLSNVQGNTNQAAAPASGASVAFSFAATVKDAAGNQAVGATLANIRLF